MKIIPWSLGSGLLRSHRGDQQYKLFWWCFRRFQKGIWWCSVRPKPLPHSRAISLSLSLPPLSLWEPLIALGLGLWSCLHSPPLLQQRTEHRHTGGRATGKEVHFYLSLYCSVDEIGTASWLSGAALNSIEMRLLPELGESEQLFPILPPLPLSQTIRVVHTCQITMDLHIRNKQSYTSYI